MLDDTDDETELLVDDETEAETDDDAEPVVVMTSLGARPLVFSNESNVPVL